MAKPNETGSKRGSNPARSVAMADGVMPKDSPSMRIAQPATIGRKLRTRTTSPVHVQSSRRPYGIGRSANRQSDPARRPPRGGRFRGARTMPICGVPWLARNSTTMRPTTTTNSSTVGNRVQRGDPPPLGKRYAHRNSNGQTNHPAASTAIMMLLGGCTTYMMLVMLPVARPTSTSAVSQPNHDLLLFNRINPATAKNTPTLSSQMPI